MSGSYSKTLEIVASIAMEYCSFLVQGSPSTYPYVFIVFKEIEGKNALYPV